MTKAARLVGIGAAAALGLAGVLWGCKKDDATSCSTELAQVTFTAKAGTVQPDGSVTVYGTIQLGDPDAGAELTVHAVYVAGQSVMLGSNNFNFRSWSIALPSDVLTAYAGGTGQATIPVVAYLYGGCVAHLPAAQEPVVTIPASDGGVDGGPGDGSGSDGGGGVEGGPGDDSGSDGGGVPSDGQAGQDSSSGDAGAD